MRKTPSIITRQPRIVISFNGSLNLSHENNTVKRYPKLTIGYAILRGTRDRTINQDTALIPKTARPAKTNGLDIAVRSIDGAFDKLDISPTFVMPCFNRSCANAANITLNTIIVIFFNTAVSFSSCLIGFDYKVSKLLFYIQNIRP